MNFDQMVIRYDISGELEEYAELHAGLCSLCEDDLQALQSIRKSIENDMVPSTELLKNYTSLRGENYRWVIERLAGELMLLGIDQAFDL